MSYWYGSLGTVTFGPDFLHLHLMFALRQDDDGSTEGQALAFTKHRRGPLGWLFNKVLLHATAFAARYFAYGDTRVFQTIRFDFRNPISADRAVLAFIHHLEAQPLAAWREQTSPHAVQSCVCVSRVPTKVASVVKRTVLVTGCSSGFGLGIAQALAAGGWTVFASVRDPARAPAQLAGLRLVSLDLTDQSQIASVARGIDRLDCLVNNAGYGLNGPFSTYTAAQMQHQMQVTCLAQHCSRSNCCRRLPPHEAASSTSPRSPANSACR